MSSKRNLGKIYLSNSKYKIYTSILHFKAEGNEADLKISIQINCDVFFFRVSSSKDFQHTKLS